MLLIPLAALLIYVSGDLPDRGDPDAPANLHISPELVALTERDIKIPNLVSAVLADVVEIASGNMIPAAFPVARDDDDGPICAA